MNGFKVRRGSKEYTAADLAELRGWATSGNVGPGDDVWNPVVGRWVRAKEMPDLHGLFPAPSNANTLIFVGAILTVVGTFGRLFTPLLLLGIALIVVGVLRRPK